MYVDVGGKALRCGYTTGTCATGAALGATLALVEGVFPVSVAVETPSGTVVEMELINPQQQGAVYQCAVRKDGGDDPDVTHGHLIVAQVWRCETPGVHIQGGQGVGTVTKPGLDQAVGQSAINSVPRAMMEKALLPYVAEGGLQVVVSVPEGEALAGKTFNPRLGIVGGISILGTSGLVRPMSQQALMDTLAVEISMVRATGQKTLLLLPGNYAQTFAQETLGLSLDKAVICSNYIGHGLDCAKRHGFERVLLVGHMGKLAKVAAGGMQTHSSICDGRREVFCTHAALCGADRGLIQQLYQTVTADQALGLLQEAGLQEVVVASIMDAIGQHLTYRGGNMAVDCVAFSNQFGLLGQTAGANAQLTYHREQGERT